MKNEIGLKDEFIMYYSLLEKCPNTEFFLVLIFVCTDWIRKSPYLVRIQENTDQKKIRIWTLFMYYLLRGSWFVKIIKYFCPLVLSTCHNWELLIVRPHRPLYYKKIRTTTTTAFLISNTVVPESLQPIIEQHSILNLSHPYLKFQVS